MKDNGIAFAVESAKLEENKLQVADADQRNKT